MSSNYQILILNSKNKLVVLLLIISLVILSSESVNAGVKWEETFDTSLSDDWMISHGAAEVKDGVLIGTGCFEWSTVNAGEDCTNSIWFNSNSSTGTWSLDYYLSNPKNSSFLFYFVGEGVSSVGGYPDADYYLFILGTEFSPEDNIQVKFGYHYNDHKNGLGNSTFIPTIEMEGWTHIDITRSEDGVMNLYFDGILIDTFVGISIGLQSAEHLNLQFGVGDKIDNLKYSDTIDLPATSSTSSPSISSNSTESASTHANITTAVDKSDSSPLLFIGAGVGLSGIIIITRLGLKKKLVSQTLKTAKAIKTIAGISQSFEVTDYSMLALMAKPHKLSNIDSDEFQESIPNELLLYRYLMHPIRLTIMKLLDSNNHLPSFEIRQILGITWGEYNSHLKSLESKGYIEIQNSFDEQAHLILNIYITEDGGIKYQELFVLLSKFTQKEAPIRRLVGKNSYPIYDTDLYPSTGKEF